MNASLKKFKGDFKASKGVFVNTFFPKKILAGFFILAISVFGQPQIVVPSGDLGALKSHLSTKSNCTLLLQGAFTINEALTISNKSNLTLSGAGATWTTGPNFKLSVVNSSRIRIENLKIIDNAASIASVPGLIFDFVNCKFCGVDGVEHSATSPLRIFSLIRTGSKSCYVKNCNISNVHTGVWLGDNLSEPSGNPTSGCLVEGNVISKYVVQGIVTNSRLNIYASNSPDSRLGHIIRNNLIELPNPNGNENSSVGIRSRGNENIIEGNTIKANPNSLLKSNIGIGIQRSNRIICRQNKVYGKFASQGIGLSTSSNSLISDNIIDSATSSEFHAAGIGIVAFSDTDPISSDNIITNNQILGCKNGIDFAGTFSVGTKILGNVISGSTQYGILSNGAQFEAMGNHFIGNRIALYSGGGSKTDVPNRISGNLFENTTSAVFFNENTSQMGRPFIFETNTVNDWGDANLPEALILRCGTSVIKNNVFRNTRTSGSGWPVPLMVATKSYSYGQMQHVIDGNTLIGVPLSFTDIKGDRVGVNLRYGSYTNYDLASMGDSKEIMEIENALAPTNSRVLGAWASGDKIHIRNPVVGGYRGYVCVYAADTCSWKGFGLVEP